MKKWTSPEVQEINVSETAYGGTTVTEYDNVYQNAEGKWEATFIPS